MENDPKESDGLKLPAGSSAKYSPFIYQSYAMGGFLDNFTTSPFQIRVYAFFENVMLLPKELVGIAFIIYGIWNMINDPLAGYLSDRPYKFIQKWGRRFPWFFITVIPFAASYLFIFIPPFQSEIGKFIWLVFTICLFDTLFSFWQLNWLAQFPTKFRNAEDRAKVGGASTLWGILGVVLGMLVPPMFIGSYGSVQGYINSALFVVGVALVAAILIIPGMKENKETRELNYRIVLEQQEQKRNGTARNYWQTLGYCVKQRNFMSYLFLFLSHMLLTGLMLGSLPYWIPYILNSDDPDIETIISGALLVGVIIAVPLWTWVSKKKGNRIAYLYGTLATSGVLLLFFFLGTGLIISAVLIVLLGISIGAMWTLMYPGFSDVIDEIVASTGVRNEGIYTGIRTFFGRLSIVLQSLAFWIVHALTNYDPEAAIGGQIPSAQWGIRIHMSLIPFIFYFLSFFVMWKLYDLTPEKLQKVKAKISDLGL